MNRRSPDQFEEPVPRFLRGAVGSVPGDSTLDSIATRFSGGGSASRGAVRVIRRPRTVDCGCGFGFASLFGFAGLLETFVTHLEPADVGAFETWLAEQTNGSIEAIELGEAIVEVPVGNHADESAES